MMARFSEVAGEAGYPDTVRDVRGFALKFYTRDGNYDIVGNNTPVFFINDPLKFPDFIHSQKRDPQTHLRSQDMQWDFWSHSPESCHQVTYLMGDRGLPASYRNMNGYGSHTFKWVNKDGQVYWVKYHFHTQQGVKNMSAATAAKIAGEDTDYFIKDLYDAIAHKNYPTWKVYVQIIPYEAGMHYKHDIFDVTKVVSKKDYPLHEVGYFTLNKNPDNYFDDVEEAAFSPANLVPGVEASPDKLLQGRLFAYKDAERYRLGVNFENLPVNRPHNVKHPANYEQDGFMAEHQGHQVNYEPNGENGPVEDHAAKIKPYDVSGKADSYDTYAPDYYSAAGALYRLYPKAEQDRLIETLKSTLGTVKSHTTKVLETRQFYHADHEYGERVAKALGLDMSEIKGK